MCFIVAAYIEIVHKTDALPICIGPAYLLERIGPAHLLERTRLIVSGESRSWFVLRGS